MLRVLDASEIVRRTAFSRALDLQSGEGFRHHEGDALRSRFRGGQHALKLSYGCLRLDLHGANINEGEVLVRAAAKLTMRSVTGLYKARDISTLEKAGHGDAHQMATNINVDGKLSAHACTVA